MSHISYYGSHFDLQVANLTQSVSQPDIFLASIIYYPRGGVSRVWETRFERMGSDDQFFVLTGNYTDTWPMWLHELDSTDVPSARGQTVILGKSVTCPMINLGAEVRSVAGQLARVIYRSLP